ncbi:MAG: polyprenyl synthetase family protein, partial [bacterium]
SKSDSKSIVSLIKRGNLQNSDIAHIMSFVKEHGGIDYAQNKAKSLIDEAVNLLEVFPDSVYKSSLHDFAHFVIERQS